MTASGNQLTIVSDDSWQAATGPILESDHYNGEKYDARAELGDWSSPGYPADNWLKPRIESPETGRLVAKVCQPVRPQETLKAKSVKRAPDGEWVFDFGQNLVGRARIQIAAEHGETLTLRFAEMLKPDGSLYRDNLRSAEVTDRYTFKDDQPVSWEPRFTFHGFQYVGISGIESTPTVESVEAVVLHTDLPATGTFSCSNELLNQLQQNIVWGQKGNEAKQYANLSRQVADAFNREFVHPDGRLKTESQTGYLLALGFDLLPEEKRPVALKALIADLESRNWHLSTGLLRTGLLMPVLSKAGRNDVAYRVVLQETYPGWLYSVRQGATTMWERWNSYTHENGFGDAAMNSFNHYAYGAVGEWMYSVIAGIDAAEPGFRKILIQPQPGGRLTWAKGRLESPCGVIATAWKLEDSKFTLDVTIPPNTSAIIRLPDGQSHETGAGTYTFETNL